MIASAPFPIFPTQISFPTPNGVPPWIPVPAQEGTTTPGQLTNISPTAEVDRHSPAALAKQYVYDPAVPTWMLESGPLTSISGCDPQLAPVAISFRLIETRPPDPKVSSGSLTRLG